MNKSFQILFIVILSYLVQAQGDETLKITLKQTSKGRRQFVDSSGRERIFHGVNAVVKGPPWVPETEFFNVDSSLTEKDFQFLDDLGLNMIRLGAMWPGVEPEEGKFDENYIAKLQKISAWGKKYGIYILLDMHQDVLSEKYCGEGVPAFAAEDHGILKFPEPLSKPFTVYWDKANKFPKRKDCSTQSWGDLYFTQAAGTAFQNLYKNKEYLQKWGNFWKKIADSFKNQNEVLGIELINEPWAGDTISNPLLLLPGVADKENLQPAYDYLSEQIWNIDSQMLIFFAGVTWDDFAKAGFQNAPGGEKNANKSVYAFHYYEPPQYNLEPYIRTRLADADRLNTGAMLTETERPEPNSKTDLERLAAWDKYLVSWSQWEYKSFCIQNHTTEYQRDVTQWDQFGSCKTGYGGNMWNADGSERKESTKNYARTYPRAVAGEIVEFKFDPDNGYFNAVWKADPTIKEPTEIYLCERFNYNQGFEVIVLPLESLEYKKVRTNVLHFTYKSNVKDQQIITVQIKSKNQEDLQ